MNGSCYGGVVRYASFDDHLTICNLFHLSFQNRAANPIILLVLRPQHDVTQKIKKNKKMQTISEMQKKKNRIAYW
jgi:hypothetical protein